MKFGLRNLFIVISSTCSILSGCNGNVVKTWDFFSPDEKLNLKIELNNGFLYYNVLKDDVECVLKSKLGIETEEIDFNKLNFDQLIERKNVNLKYSNISGKVKDVDTTYNEFVLKFKQSDYCFDVNFRIFNDGYGFSYEIDSSSENKKLNWKKEITQYDLPQKSVTYSMRYIENHDYATLPSPDSPDYEDAKNEPYYSYEGIYKKATMKNLTNASYVYPFLYSPDKTVYSLLSEAGLVGSSYHGSMLKFDDEGKLSTIHAQACGHNYGKTLDLPFSSPWRVASIGSLSQVVESNVFENILGDVEYWKPDNYDSLSNEEKQIYDYDWVEPGTGLWSVLMYDGKYENPFDYQSDYEFQDHLVDICEKMGWKWIVLDADWYFDESYKQSMIDQNRKAPCEFSEARFKQFSARAHSKGIKVFVWAHVFQSFYPENKMTKTLDEYKALGIDGVKIDFWDGLYDYKKSKDSKMESKEMISYYEKFYQECAKRKMHVDCHGCNKPTSERRIYPNVISREAIYGSENKMNLSADNSVLLSLTRCVTGPSDFTPATKPLVSNTISTAHNMAICITMESGVQCLSAMDYEFVDPISGELTTAGEFYKNIPSVWDETHLIAANPDNYCIYERKSGDKYYVGGLNVNEGAYELDFSFLESGDYIAEIFEDGSDNQINKRTLHVNRDSIESINCIRNGGFVILIQKTN